MERPQRSPEQMSLLFDVWLVMHLASGVLDGALAGSGLSGDDFGVYSLLRVFGPATPGQVARWTGMRPTTVSAALGRLARRGHSVQQDNPADGRSYLVGLSPSGAAAHAVAARAFLAVLARVDHSLQPDAQAQRVSLQQLDAALRGVADLDPRPYALAAESGNETWQLTYSGAPLTPQQEAAVRAYVEFVRTTPSTTTDPQERHHGRTS